MTGVEWSEESRETEEEFAESLASKARSLESVDDEQLPSLRFVLLNSLASP
jgi:hypothetical protein